LLRARFLTLDALHAFELEGRAVFSGLLGEMPKTYVVVSVRGLDDVVFVVELHPHLTEIVAQRAANPTTQAFVVPFGAPVQEQLSSFAHPRVVIEILVIMQGACEARQEGEAGLGAIGARLEVRCPQPSQTGVVRGRQAFDARVLEHIREGEELTRDNTKLTLTIAANYGGRWDILQAAERCRLEDPAAPITEERLARFLSMAYAPEPDLFIRTGGEQRVSNFLLWQLAYTELYFTEALWPDFDTAALDAAMASYRQRERRFGRTSEQIKEGEPVIQAG